MINWVETQSEMTSEQNSIDITILIPTKNEKLTISQFIDWCKEGLSKTGLVGEIIFLDSSTDETPEIAILKGAKVVSVKGEGLGRAYAHGQGLALGKWVILGDADCTYDFKEIGIFIDQLRKGSDFVIGNRFKGEIQKNAMPIHHQYFGTPLTTWFFRSLLGIPVGDIHCGMRAMTRELYRKLEFTEMGWEYSSEMIVCARNCGAKISEVAINFFKEPFGRLSHQKRNGWLTPFRAGLGAIRVTLMFALDRVLIFLGIVLWIGGFVGTVLAYFDWFYNFRNVNFGTFSSLYFTLTSIIGGLIVSLGAIVRSIFRSYDPFLSQLVEFCKKLPFKIAGLALLILQTVTFWQIFNIYTSNQLLKNLMSLERDSIIIIRSNVILCILALLGSVWLVAKVRTYIRYSSSKY